MATTLTPQPTAGQSFLRWTGACSRAGTGPCTLTMDGVTAHVVGAEFSRELFTGTWSGTYTYGSMSAVLQQTGSVVSGRITDTAGCLWQVSGSGSGSQLSLPSWALLSNPAPSICIGATATMSGTLASSRTTITQGLERLFSQSGPAVPWTFTLTLTGRPLADVPVAVEK